MTRGSPFTFGQLAAPVLPDGAPMPGLGALGAYSGLRRSVIDPETGAASLSADALALAPDPDEVVSRGMVLPLGRTRSGETVLASQGPIHALGKAIEGLPDALQQAVDAVRFFGDVASGRKGVFDPATGHVSDEAMGAAGTAAGLAMTGSMPFAVPSGALRTFGGRAAATADHAALDRAAGMQASGAAPDAIWRDTGWGLGRDGAARFEIPDDAARLRPHDGSPATTLGQALDHPALFAAYPGLRDVDVFHRPDLGPNAAANPSRNWVALNLSDPQALESLLHEGQHLVQRREGFAPGASPIDPALAAHPQVAEVAALRQRLAGRDDPAALALADRTDQAVRLDAYRTAAGEVEARNVEGRRPMTPAERAASPPWATQDVPTDRQWIPAGRGEGVTGDGAQLKLGETAPADPLAALESGLAGLSLDAHVPAGPARVDPGAPSWDLYHGSTAGPDFQRFDPNVGKAVGHSERGALFLTPDPDAASFYAGGTGAGAEAGPRVYRTTVDPGRTRVFDLPEMIEGDPTLGDRARAALLGERGTPATAAETARADALRNAYREDLLASRAQDRDINRQLAEMGLPPSASTGATYGHGYLGAVIQMAKEQGLDTAVIRGLAEHGGADQVVALTPNRVRSAYAPDQLLYSGAGLGLGAAALALAQPGDAQAATAPSAPSTPRGASPVSFGLPFGSLAPTPIPNASPDDPRTMVRRIPFDPSEIATLVRGLSTQGGPDASGSDLAQRIASLDLNGPAGALIHQPGLRGAGPDGAPVGVAQDEAAVQALERQTGMVPGGAGAGSQDAPAPSPIRRFGDLTPLFDRAPMGAPQSFAGTSGTIVPPAAVPGGDAADGPSGGPAPGLPQLQGIPAASVAAAPRLRTFGELPSTVAPRAPAAAAPVPATTGSVAAPPIAAGQPAAAPDPSAPAEPSIGDRIFAKLADPKVSSMLTSLGIGLLSNKGFGAGVASGLKTFQEGEDRRAVTDLASRKFGLEQREAAMKNLGQNATYNWLIQKGKSPADAQAAVLGSISGRPELLQSYFSELSPKKDPGSGFTMDPATGRASFIPGGPQDPATIKAQAEARQEDKTITPLSDPTARLKAGIAQNDTRQAWIDPNGKVTFDDGQTPRLFTVKGPSGETVTKRYNPATGQAEEIPGAAPPAVDTTGIPAGVDPATYRKELAKATVSEQKGATQRTQQAHAAMPILDRAEQAYGRLAQNGGIGPYQASGLNRAIGGMAGRQNEIDRQEYEAAAKDLELLKAQISMKGQGAISDSERRLLGYTLPRLDAASADTGLNTLRGIRDQFGRTMSADGLPTRPGAGQGQGPTTGAAIPIPGLAVQALQRDPNLRDQFEAKYGQGSASRFLGGR